MNLKTVITPAAVALTLALGAAPAPADAQNRDNRSRSRHEDARTQPRENARTQPRADARVQPRDDARARSTNDERRGRVEPNRSFEGRRNDRRFDRVAPYRSRFVAPRFVYPRLYRPGFSFGLGLFFGSPVPYPYGYPAYRYGYAPAFARGAAYGGISFGITPMDAAIYVDGDYAGDAREFGSVGQPLTLAAGTHRIEIEAPGREPIVFDVNVLPGQVIPYQGRLQPGY
jgi:hypothetical protein